MAYKKHKQPDAAASKKDAKERKVLIVDDDDMLLETLKVALSYEGLGVTATHDSSQACALTKSAKPDVILLDLYMPGTGGLEVLKNLKADEDTARIPVIIVTGSSEVKDVMDGINAGAFDYIVKPVDAAVLMDKVRRALKIHAQP